MAKKKTDNPSLEARRAMMKDKLMRGEYLEQEDLLEILLYLEYSSRNTKIIAHNLLKRFGTIDKVFSASAEALLSVGDMTDSAVSLLKLQKVLMNKCDAKRGAKSDSIKLTPKNAGEYIMKELKDYQDEVFILFILNEECRLKKSVALARGIPDSIYIKVREIIKCAVEENASYVIVAHNHPNATQKASDEDMEFTLELERALSFVNIRLAEHIIVSGERCISLIDG